MQRGNLKNHFAAVHGVWVDNLARHTKEGVILSWAELGQGGHSHVNNKAEDDVITMMSKRGFKISRAEDAPLHAAPRRLWRVLTEEQRPGVPPPSPHDLPPRHVLAPAAARDSSLDLDQHKPLRVGTMAAAGPTSGCADAQESQGR